MRKICQTLTTVAVLACWSASSFAATKDGFDVPALEAKTPWLAWVFSVVFVAGICVVGFKNSRRTHLD